MNNEEHARHTRTQNELRQTNNNFLLMVKRQREKQYNSAREQRDLSQIRSNTSYGGGDSTVQRRLPFSHCALTLAAFETPVCNKHGIVFDASALMSFLLKHKQDPVTGEPMSSRDVISLNMDKDEEGRWQCPVLSKPFMDHTKIVAILQPGHREANVISWQAYDELNVKAKNYEDLISGIKFDRTTDVLLLNDPNDDDLNRRRDINSFFHILHSRELKAKDTSTNACVNHSVTATRVMEQLKKERGQTLFQAESTSKGTGIDETTIVIDGNPHLILAADVTGVQYSTGIVASSFTSTSSQLANENLQRGATSEEIILAQCHTLRKLRKKGYVRLQTTHGNLTLELHCDMVPRTCINFLGLCREGRYDHTIFHRLIPSFMIQGGKRPKDEPDESLWGKAFGDEFDDRLKHAGVGILSMANSGPNTNQCQFFITFRSCNHLDRKHTVFGSLIDGLDTLKKLEKIPTDKKERPTEEIKILSVVVLEDPAQSAKEIEMDRIEKRMRERLGFTKRVVVAGIAKGESSSSEQPHAVGKYLLQKKTDGTPTLLTKAAESNGTAIDESCSMHSRLPDPPKRTKFGDFSGW